MSLTSKSATPSSAKPTTEQLANLAAAISEDGTEPPESLVNRALAVWEAAHELLNKPASSSPTLAPPGPPEPKRYPVTLDQFLLLMLPHLKGRTGERYGLFREYLRFRLRHPLPPDRIWAWDNVPDNPIPFDSCNPRIVPGIDKPYSALTPIKTEPPEPTADDVASRFGLWRSSGIPDPHSFLYHARAFLDWYRDRHAADIGAKRRAAGEKGRASQKRMSNKSNAASRKPDPSSRD